MLKQVDSEIKELFSKTEDELFTSFTLDNKGNKIGFYKGTDNTKYILRKNLNDVARAIKYQKTGSKTIFVNADKSKSATKHKFMSDNSEVIYKYDSEFRIIEIISFNADLSIFRTSLTSFGELTEIYNPSSEKSKTFYIKCKKEIGLINIEENGNLVQKGAKFLLKYLRRKFAKELIKSH